VTNALYNLIYVIDTAFNIHYYNAFILIHIHNNIQNNIMNQYVKQIKQVPAITAYKSFEIRETQAIV